MIEYLSCRQILWQCCAISAPKTLPLRPDAFAPNHAFESSRLTAFTWSLRRAWNKHVADFTCGPVFSVKWMTIQHNACSNAGSNCKKDEISCTFRSSSPAFPD